MIDRRHRELTAEDIKKIADTYHAWRGEPIDGQKVEYQDVAGFCKAVKLEEIRKQGHILTPGRYVGSEEEEEDEEEFEKMKQMQGKNRLASENRPIDIRFADLLEYTRDGEWVMKLNAKIPPCLMLSEAPIFQMFYCQIWMQYLEDILKTRNLSRNDCEQMMLLLKLRVVQKTNSLDGPYY
jgi:hypothetical protein